MTRRPHFIGTLVVVVWTMTLSAAQGQSLPSPPQLTAPVNDFANVIDDSTERELDRRIRALKAASGDVVVVATVNSFKPYADIDMYAVKMFENGGRGIGDKGKDNGLLVVVAVDDRRIRIEVGYDLEQFVTDGFAGETIRDVITPQFRNGNYSAGLLAGTTVLINRVAQARGVSLQDVPAPPPPRRTNGSGFPWWIIVIIVIVILSNRRQRRRRVWGAGPWSGWNSGIGPFGGGGFGGGGFGGGFGGFGGGGGGGGGGFGGFGGGRSGGGGASGGW